MRPGELSDAGLRQEQEKLFFVSPFIEMTTRYHFRLSPPRARVRLRILKTDREGPLLAATFVGRRRGPTTATLLRAFSALPLVTPKIVAAIHWEALRLWLKGARPVQRSNGVTTNTFLAAGKRNDYTAPALPATASRKPDPRGSALVH